MTRGSWQPSPRSSACKRISAPGHDPSLPLPGYGLRLCASVIGSGKPVVVVPGNTSDVFPLAPLLAQLPEQRIIAVNRPGGGASDGMDYNQVAFRAFAVETLAAVLDAFALDRVPISAHSIGGHASLWLVLDHPERITALAQLGLPGNILRICPQLALRLLAVPLLKRLLIRLITPKTSTQALRSLTFMGHPPEVVANLPAAANFQPIQGGGHLPWLEQPTACARQIDAFLG